jgi:hypothetical protein
MRGLLPGPWGHGNGLEHVGSEIWKSGSICVAGGMGGSDHYRVAEVSKS